MSTRMLCYKAWLDTRWRFVIGLCVLSAMAGLIARLSAARQDQGDLAPLWCLFAILLGSGGLVSQAVQGDACYLLSLPVSRGRLVLTRVAVVLLELFLLALLPPLAVTLWSAATGTTYVTPALFVAALSLFIGGAIFFAIPFLLSSLFEQFWVPIAVMLTGFVVISIARQVEPDLTRFTLSPLLTARDYLNGGSLPWMGLLDSVAVSAALIALAVRNIARRDF